MSKVLSLVILMTLMSCNNKRDIRQCKVDVFARQLEYMCFPESTLYIMSFDLSKAKYSCGESKEVKILKRKGEGKCTK